MPRLLPSLLFGLSLALPSAAWAHAEPPGGRVPFVLDGQLIGGGTSWGVVLDEGGEWRRTCEEAPGARIRFFHRATDGRVLVGTEAGLFTTDDGGCTYAAVPGPLEGQHVAAGARPASQPGTLFVVTATAGRDNGVYVSHDDGRTFTAPGPLFAGVRFESLVVSDDGSALWAAGSRTDLSGPFVLAAEEGGATQTDHSAAFGDAARVRIAGLDEQGRPALVVVDLERTNHVEVASRDLSSRTRLGSVAGEVFELVPFQGRAYITVNRSELRVLEGEAFVPLEGGPSHCLMRVPGDARLWGCGQLRDGGHFLSSEDGVTWTAYMGYFDVDERDCPEGSAGRELCWAFIDLDAGPVPADAGPQPSPPVPAADRGAGAQMPAACSGTGSARGLAPLILALICVRRRR